MKKPMQVVFYKELLSFARDRFRIFFELVLPLFAIVPIYATVSSMAYSHLPSQPLWANGHEFSTETRTNLTSLFMYRNYSDCTQDNKHILISTHDNSLVAKISQILTASNLAV